MHPHGDAASVSPGEFGDKLDFYPDQLDCIDKNGIVGGNCISMPVYMPQHR